MKVILDILNDKNMKNIMILKIDKFLYYQVCNILLFINKVNEKEISKNLSLSLICILEKAIQDNKI